MDILKLRQHLPLLADERLVLYRSVSEGVVIPLPIGFMRMYQDDDCIVDLEICHPLFPERTATVPSEHEFKVGDQVIKHPEKWQWNEMSDWGRGKGIGIIVDPPFVLQEGSVDVAWPTGRCFEKVEQLLPYQGE